LSRILKRQTTLSKSFSSSPCEEKKMYDPLTIGLTAKNCNYCLDC